MEFDALWVKPTSPGMWVPMDDTSRSRQSVRDVWEKWVWTGDDRDIAGVWVKGRRVVEDEHGSGGIEVVDL